MIYYADFIVLAIVKVLVVITLALVLKKKRKVLVFTVLYFYHTLFTYIFTKLTFGAQADSFFYYSKSSSSDYEMSFEIMRDFVLLFAYIPSHLMGMSYFLSMFFAGTISYIGLVMCFSRAYDFLDKKYLLIVLMFLPSIHYWTAGISKESLVIFGSGLIINEIYKKKWNIVVLCMGFMVVFMTRPYMAALLGAGIVAVQLLANEKVSLFKRYALIVLSLAIFVGSSLFLFSRLGIDSSDIAGEEILKRQQGWAEGGSTIDLSKYNFVQRIFVFLYRPLFYDASNIPMLASSIENLFLLILSSIVLYKLYRSFSLFRLLPLAVRFNALYFIFSVILLSTVTANLGTAVRKKATFLPSFIISVSYIYNVKRKKSKKKL